MHKDKLHVKVMDLEHLTDITRKNKDFEFSEDLKKNIRHAHGNASLLEDEIQQIKTNELQKAQAEKERIILEAEAKAEEIIREATIKAENSIKDTVAEWSKKGFEKGFEKGIEEGHGKAQAQGEAELAKIKVAYTENFYEAIKELEIKKTEVLKKYIDDLTLLTVTISEKIVHTSLKSSSEVIKKMILNASENLNGKEWAKIYISKCDAELMAEGDTDLLENLKHVSEHLKIITMDEKKPGKCIIELPDEVIDASVETQLDNIEEILKNARF